MCVVGVDPGLSGAIAVISSRGNIKEYVGFEKLGKRLDLVNLIDNFTRIKTKYKPQRVFLEKAAALPNNGSVSMFNYGVTFGHLEMIVASLRLSYELIPPRVWTSVMHKGLSRDLTAKERSLQLAQSLYPNEGFTLSERARKPHDGVIDALLIAEYGRMKLRGKAN